MKIFRTLSKLRVKISSFKRKEVKCSTLGFLTVGGYKNWGVELSTAEIFFPKTGRSCKIGDLPVATAELTLCGNLACGGRKSPNSCSWFDGVGTFTATSVTLIQPREFHICWLLPSGEVLLLGGLGGGGSASSTTERVSADGSSSTADFNLPYPFQ